MRQQQAPISKNLSNDRMIQRLVSRTWWIQRGYLLLGAAQFLPGFPLDQTISERVAAQLHRAKQTGAQKYILTRS